jgi:serine phosphatase RsbU (regulator of sigma subunit)
MRLEILDVRTASDDTPRRQTLEFRNMPISIGSHSANTVQLPDVNLAEYYAMILPVGKGGEDWEYRLSVRDEDSEINGETVTAPTRLKDGDRLKISHFEISITMDAPQDLDLPQPANVMELAKIKQYPLPPRADVRHADEIIRLTPGAQNVLGRFSLKLRECNGVGQALDRTVEFLQSELGARLVWIGARRGKAGDLEFISGRTEAGNFTGEPWMFEGFLYRCMTREQFIRLPKTGQPDTQSLIAVPIIGRKGPMGLIIADTKRRTRVFDEADLHLVTAVSRFVAAQLEAVLEEQATQRAQLQAGERVLLGNLQAKLVPKAVPEFKRLEVSAYTKPGSQNSGDLYDVVKMPNGLAAFLIAHVAGGMTATARTMAELRAAFRLACVHADPSHVQLRAMNWLVFSPEEPVEVDAVIWVMNPKSGASEFSTAGTMHILLVDDKGNARMPKEESNPPVGTAKDREYAVRKVRVGEGEMLVLFTSGCMTARDHSGAELGTKRLIEAVCDTFGQSAPTALQELLADLSSFLKDGSQPDDITVMLARREGGET